MSLSPKLEPSLNELRAAWLVLEALQPANSVWTPQPGPQAIAYASRADVIGYGGAAGGGKTDLGLGLAYAPWHRRAVIFRRVFPNARGIIERSRELFGNLGRLNEQNHIWRLSDGRTIEIGAMQDEDDKKNHQGQPRDLMVFDEATEFTETQVRFVIAWNRSTWRDVRCQTLLAFNPPMDESGEWVIRVFAPWLDQTYSHPAQDGELRWFAFVDGHEIECGPESFTHKNETIRPRSRTFFHADLSDNPILESTGYGATIDALPEPLRSLLKGNFNAARVSDPWQVIPIAWVKAAQERWTEIPPEGASLTGLGCDPARGGDDTMVKAPVYGIWFAPLEVYPGASVPDGPTAAALLTNEIAAGITIGIDVIGIGSSVYDSVMASNGNAIPINNSESAGELRDKSGRFRFYNVRSASYWKFREALDPVHGEGLALPPDPELLADLCAPRFIVTTRGLKLEDKEEIKQRLGRSPDKGDAVVMAYWVGCIPRGATLVSF